MRRRADEVAVGYVQATVDLSSRTAEVAWVIGTAWQGRGYAREAASAMATLLLARGAARLVAHVHPEHAASAAVARSLGLRQTGRLVDGEDEWST